MSVTIPIEPQTPPLPFFDVGVVLDAVTYTLSFRWNVRMGTWFLTVLDEPGLVVLMGDTAVVADWPLYRAVDGRSPPGYLLAQDTSGAGVDPAIDDLGARVQLRYFSSAELAAAGIS